MLEGTPDSRSWAQNHNPQLILKFHFKDSSYTLREEYVVYDSDSFIADVGGFFGLLLGQSLLGIYYMSVEWVASSNVWKLIQ